VGSCRCQFLLDRFHVDLVVDKSDALVGRVRERMGGDRMRTSKKSGTPRAEQFVGSVSQALDSMERGLQLGATFVPAGANRSFTLMLPDIGEITYLPRLIQRLRKEAPGVGLSVRRLSRARMSDELGVGSVDLALGWVDRPPDDLRQQRLFDETFVCIVRPGHPRIGKKLSLRQFISEWHLVVGRYQGGSENFFRSLDGNLVGELLRKGVDRKVALVSPTFSRSAASYRVQICCALCRDDWPRSMSPMVKCGLFRCRSEAKAFASRNSGTNASTGIKATDGCEK
jgi:DNA-binding transcriptional LysR family regulator